MNILPRMKRNAAVSIKKVPRVFSDHLGIPALGFSSFKGDHFEDVTVEHWTYVQKTSVWQKNVSCWCFWKLRFSAILESLGLEENLWNRGICGYRTSCGCERGIQHPRPADPLGLGGEQGSCLCISCSGTDHRLLPETGHCARGAAALNPSSHLSAWVWGPWQELPLPERVRGQGAVGRLVGGVRLLSVVSEAGGSRVPLPTRWGLIPLGTDGRGRCPVTKLSLQNTRRLLPY